MHPFLLVFLSFVISASAAPSDIGTIVHRREDADNITVLTGYFGYDGCSETERAAVTQAQKDAVVLASNAAKNPGIDWGNSPAAIDFFGPPDETASRGTRQHIIGTPSTILSHSLIAQNGLVPFTTQPLDQIAGAAGSYPSRLSDWYYDRYVTLQCHDTRDYTCAGEVAAYFKGQVASDKYPVVVFCPGFFGDKRPSLSAALETINKNSVLKGYVSSLQSQATTFLHELLHIDFGTAQIAKPPSKDQYLEVGPVGHKERTQAYKAGRAKLLAQIKDGGPEKASQNSKSTILKSGFRETYPLADATTSDDNIVFFCAAVYMTGLYSGNYPAKPRAWNPLISVEDNKENDLPPPGPYSISVDDFEASDAPNDGDPASALSPKSLADLFQDSEYPAAYIKTYGSPIAVDVAEALVPNLAPLEGATTGSDPPAATSSVAQLPKAPAPPTCEQQ